MYNTVDKDLKDSVIALEKIKGNYLSKIISGKIHTIESRRNEILILLDMKSGIDYIREDENGLQGIAARCQWDDGRPSYPYNSFTIRFKRHTGAETEFEKRNKQIQHGYFYPAFTLQAYFDNRENNNLLSLGIIPTRTLYDFIEKNKGRLNQKGLPIIKEKKSDNIFLFINWNDLAGLMKTITVNEIKHEAA